jgi:glycosyltransferase involved in cell wall biosynthesis
MRRAHTEGALVLGEPVNAHPDVQNEILNTEYERLKIATVLKHSPAQKQMLEEFAMCDRFIVASEFVKRTFVEKGHAAERIDVLPYGVDVSRFTPRTGDAAGPKAFRVICVAGINIRKGIVDLLEAWRRFSPPNGELLLIGQVSPEMSGVLRQYAGTFTHIPFVPNHALNQYFTESSVFVLPSLEDGFGLVCGEAMASGLPVITTTNTGAAELIEEGINGYIVPIRSPDAIAGKLETLYTDREKAVHMGGNAAKKVRTLHSWSGYAEELVHKYHSALNLLHGKR